MPADAVDGAARPSVEQLCQRAAAAVAAGELSAAIHLITAAVESNPAVALYSDLGNLLRATGEADRAVAAFKTALLIDPSQIEIHRQLLATLLYVPGLGADDAFAERLAFAARHRPPADRVLPPPVNDRDPERRLRVGLVSSDLSNRRPIGRNLASMFLHRDRQTVALLCYVEAAAVDGSTAFFRQHSEAWRSTTGQSDRDVAQMIRTDGVDLLVICGGTFDQNRPLIACYRPAPVQVSFGDGATSGLSEIDYWVSDPVMSPDDDAERFTETVVRLPHLLNHHPMSGVPPIGPPPAIRNGHVTFGSQNRPSKMNLETVALWSSLLRAVPTARLHLRYRTAYADPQLSGRLRMAFGRHGIAPDRIRFVSTPGSYLAAYNDIDIALDPRPFSGVTTTFDALSMGVPVIGLAGDTAMSRMTASVLTSAGFPQWIAPTPAAFVALGSALATDLAQLAELRRSLPDRVATSPLCDGVGYARSLEQLWRDLWRTWCGAAPRATA